ncbi:MAG: HAMP domain-containing histidine kinase, partial [Oscillospiraceae bacterium]|nr:HAMP domain-containing histidine kinase [Oscillospiraceae bacterium]
LTAHLLEDGRVARLTGAAEQLLGADALGKPLSAWLPLQEADRIAEAAARGEGLALCGVTVAGAPFDLQCVPLDRSAWITINPMGQTGPGALSAAMSQLGGKLRAPLIPLLSALGLLSGRLEEAQDEKSRRYFASLSQSCLQLLRLSNNLLELPQYLSGQTTLHLRERDLTAFAGETVDAASPFAAARGVSLLFDPPDAPLTLAFDEQKIERLLLNLLSNALLHTPGGGKVTLSLSGAPEFVWLRVADTGEGIPPDMLPHIFHTPFAPGRDGGTLGLPLVRGIAELHGGAVMLESVVGKGTSVAVSLRRSRAASELLRSHPSADYAGGFSHALLELSVTLPSGHPLYHPTRY